MASIGVFFSILPWVGIIYSFD